MHTGISPREYSNMKRKYCITLVNHHEVGDHVIKSRAIGQQSNILWWAPVSKYPWQCLRLKGNKDSIVVPTISSEMVGDEETIGHYLIKEMHCVGV